MKRVKEMNGNEKTAYRNIKEAFNWMVGGWVNSIYDGHPEDVPETEAEAKEIIKSEALDNLFGGGGCFFGVAPREMRFAGNEFIDSVIEHLLEKDDDIGFIGTEKGWY